MNQKYLLWIMCLFIMPGLVHVSEAQEETPYAKLDVKNKISIMDRTGKKWDITHAVKKYEMNPEYFHFGIGAGAIPSVDHPVIIEKEHAGYPTSDSNLPVFGVQHNDEQRAYPASFSPLRA